MTLDASVPLFPLAQMTPQSATLRKVAAILSSPAGLAAPPQTVQSGAGRWGVTYRNIRVATPAQRLAARALLSRLTSPLRPVYVSPMEWLVAPRRLAGLPPRAPGDGRTPYDDFATFDDTSEFAGPYGDFTISDPAASGAVYLYVACNTAGVLLQAGQVASIGERLYQIETAVADTGIVPNGQKITIWPPLRADASVDDVVEAEEPVLRARLDTRSAEMAIEMTQARYGYFDLAFVEDDWTL